MAESDELFAFFVFLQALKQNRLLLPHAAHR
jgi:hypothetical protein